jgi:hypothetical protein
MRLFPKLLVSVVFVLLPLAPEEQLSPTALVSIGAGMLVCVVAWELIGGLEKCAALFESWNLTADDSSDEDVVALRRDVQEEDGVSSGPDVEVP